MLQAQMRPNRVSLLSLMRTNLERLDLSIAVVVLALSSAAAPLSEYSYGGLEPYMP